MTLKITVQFLFYPTSTKFFKNSCITAFQIFLTNCKTLYPFQFGFGSKHSTSNALINCVEQISKSPDYGNFACSIFIDLQKAFDTVDHQILFSKLHHYGIRGITQSWFKSFLTSRKQYVEINGAKSDSKFVSHGVPQNSVPGPLLFLLYVNNLHAAILYSIVNIFADDTMLFLSNNSLKSLAKK